MRDPSTKGIKGIPLTVLLTTAILTGPIVCCYIFIPDQTWRGLCESLLFPLICALIAGCLAIPLVSTMADDIIKKYNARIAYGLSKRKVLILGDDELGGALINDLKCSKLISANNVPPRDGRTQRPIDYDNDTLRSLIEDRIDLIVLTLHYSHNEPELEKWQDNCDNQIRTILELIEHSHTHPALIIYTDGTLKRRRRPEEPPTQTDLALDRSFSTLANWRGRAISDIHSLLTTLPPRS